MVANHSPRGAPQSALGTPRRSRRAAPLPEPFHLHHRHHLTLSLVHGHLRTLCYRLHPFFSIPLCYYWQQTLSIVLTHREQRGSERRSTMGVWQTSVDCTDSWEGVGVAWASPASAEPYRDEGEGVEPPAEDLEVVVRLDDLVRLVIRGRVGPAGRTGVSDSRRLVVRQCPKRRSPKNLKPSAPLSSPAGKRRTPRRRCSPPRLRSA